MTELSATGCAGPMTYEALIARAAAVDCGDVTMTASGRDLAKTILVMSGEIESLRDRLLKLEWRMTKPTNEVPAPSEGSLATPSEPCVDRRTLSPAEVVSIIIHTIECESECYQSFEWEPINKAIKALREAAGGRGPACQGCVVCIPERSDAAPKHIEHHQYRCIVCTKKIPSSGMCTTCSSAWGFGRNAGLDDAANEVATVRDQDPPCRNAIHARLLAMRSPHPSVRP